MNREERDKSAERIRAKMRARGEWVRGDPPIKKSSEELKKKKKKLSELEALVSGDIDLKRGVDALSGENSEHPVEATQKIDNAFAGGYSKGKQVGKEKP